MRANKMRTRVYLHKESNHGTLVIDTLPTVATGRG